MKNLHTYITADSDELAKPEAHSDWSAQMAALHFLQDFKKIKPVVVDATVSADELKSLMHNLHETLISVEDGQGHFIGIVSVDDLTDQSLIRKQAEGFNRTEIRVADLMTRRKELPALSWEEVSEASIADVVSVMKRMGKRDCLVIDQSDHSIRGIFSISDIAEKLQQPIEIRDQSSFYRMFAPV